MMEQLQGGSLIAILDELSALLKQSRNIPMSSSIVVNKAEALDLLDAALSVVPAQVAEADSIVAGAKGLVDKAKAEAAEILQTADRDSRRAAEKESIVRVAKERAAEIIAEAEATAKRLSDEADSYCDRQLAQLEVELEQIGRQVKAGRTVIQSRKGEVPT